MRYMLLIYASEEDYSQMTSEEHVAIMQGHGAFAQEAMQRGILLGGAPLQPISAARTVQVRKGKTPASFKVQYPTDAGLKCLYTATGTVQEVFLICSDAEAAGRWLRDAGIASFADVKSTCRPLSRISPSSAL